MIARSWTIEEVREMMISRYKASVIRWISSEDPVYFLMTIVNNTILYFKFAENESQTLSSHTYTKGTYVRWQIWLQSSFHKAYLHQIIRLYSLDIYNFIYQVYLNKGGGEKFNEKYKKITIVNYCYTCIWRKKKWHL